MKIKIKDILKSIGFRNLINSKKPSELVLVYKGELRHTFDKPHDIILDSVDYIKFLSGKWCVIKNGKNVYQDVNWTKVEDIPQDALFVDFDSLMKDYRYRSKVIQNCKYEIIDNGYMGIVIDDEIMKSIIYGGLDLFYFIEYKFNKFKIFI